MRLYFVFIFYFLSFSLFSRENKDSNILTNSTNELLGPDTIFIESEIIDSLLLVSDYHKNGNIKCLRIYNITSLGIDIKDSLLNSLTVQNKQSYLYFNNLSGLKPEPYWKYLKQFENSFEFRLDYFNDTIKEYLSYEINYSNNKIPIDRGYKYKGVKQHGEWYIYNRDGSLKTITNYSFGLKDGSSISFVGNKIVCSSFEYKEGLRHGKSVIYRLYSGDIKIIKNYNMGKLIAKYRPERNGDYNTQKEIIYYGKTIISPMGN